MPEPRTRGRPRAVPNHVEQQIVALHAGGAGCRQIARFLNDTQIPTAHGGLKWWPGTIRRLLRSRGYPSRRAGSSPEQRLGELRAAMLAIGAG